MSVDKTARAVVQVAQKGFGSPPRGCKSYESVSVPSTGSECAELPWACHRYWRAGYGLVCVRNRYARRGLCRPRMVRFLFSFSFLVALLTFPASYLLSVLGFRLHFLAGSLC